MPHTIKLAREHYAGLHPQSCADHRSIRNILAMLLTGVLLVLALMQLQRHWQTVRELTWASAPATIEDVRPVLVSKFDGNFGGAMLYQVQVLAKFSGSGKIHEQWIALSQPPSRLSSAQFQAFRLKNATATVRWNPANSNQATVEIY